MTRSKDDGPNIEAPDEIEPFRLSLRRPERVAKLPPCQSHCPGDGEVRRWIGYVAQRERLGLGPDESYEKAWSALVERNPFPATMGRVCPHPCEAGCNRNDKDGPVSINALERFLGDWAIERGLSLPREVEMAQPEHVGVVGAGPAGLSFAYQMARRGYRVTVYESHAEPGGMLRYGIPDYRLPESVLTAEIQRILDVGVELVLGTAIGRDLTVEQLRTRHPIVFLGIGAQKSRMLGVPGEAGPGVWSGTTYLECVNDGTNVDLGRRIVVVGGGNTAIDAARAARRQGVDVTLLYRRTRAEMPAIAAEIDDAIEEHVAIQYLASPIAVLRNAGAVSGVRVQRMRLGDPGEDGRPRPMAIDGAVDELPADAVIVAISQEPDWSGLENLHDVVDPGGGNATATLAGGDVLGLGVASLAIGHGRTAAEAAHARLRGLPMPAEAASAPVSSAQIKLDYYASAAPTAPARRPADEWLTRPHDEIVERIDEEAFLAEAARCLSCGLCFGCQHCLMYCNPGGYTRLAEPQPGAYFALAFDRCEGCGKCIEVCPSGFLGLAGL